MKKQDVTGLEGKALELANAFNSAVEKIVELEGKSADFDTLKTEIATLKENAKGTELEAKMVQLEKDFAERANSLEAKLSISKKEEKSLETFLVEQKSSIDKLVTKSTREIELDVKADYLRAGVANSTQAMRLDTVGQLATRKLVLSDLFPRIPVSANSNGVIRYVDWDQATIARAATVIAEGGNFPESTAAFAEYTLNLQKIGDTMAISEEVMQDTPRLAAEIRNFLGQNVALIEDTQLLTGSGVAPNLKGLATSAGAYTAVASGIVDAGIPDLILKVSESITVGGGSKYMPNVCLMNIADINKMKLKKDATTSQYIIPPFAAQNFANVNGIQIIECNAVVADTMYVFDSRFAKIYEIEGYNVTLGVADGQFIADMMTMKARKRENLLIRKADEGGFKKVVSIAAALVTLAS